MKFKIILIIVVATFIVALSLNGNTGFVSEASGECVGCHRNVTPTIVHTFERSPMVDDVTCLDCHKPLEGQEVLNHNGFEVVSEVTAGNCAKCHAKEYEQFLGSRHAAPAWTAVAGINGEFDGNPAFTEEQIAHAAQFHPDAMSRGPNALALLEGPGAIENGCGVCHEIGAPNPDGSVGNCSKCHLRHYFSIEEARLPETCGHCHMGPDHAQLEIYEESTHGILYRAKFAELDLTVKPDELTTEHMPVPTCATCHMSALGSDSMTHNVGERLSYYLFAEISEMRDDGQENRERMKAVCTECHSSTHVESFYTDADLTLQATNARVAAVKEIVDALHADGFLSADPFDEPADFEWFDYWHYFGRTTKHGAYMGGSDYTQWHGNYELLLRQVEWEQLDRDLRGLE